jgi:hypothetical protein
MARRSKPRTPKGNIRIVRRSRMTGKVVKVLDANVSGVIRNARDADVFLDGYGRRANCGPRTYNSWEYV